MSARPIVLDANILIRFVLGEKVPASHAARDAVVDAGGVLIYEM